MTMDRNAFLSDLIGRPYAIGARGPEAFDCYGLTRHLQRELARIEMPDVPFANPTTRAAAEAMLSHPERQAWEEVEHPEDLDIVLMGNVAKRDFHLGTFVIPAISGVVVHTDQANGVVADDIPSLKAVGFNYLRFFRRKT
ncbi:peptidoglycan endopeptidase [Enterovirga sp. CN4-39]|uniref:peptidoglycan endopeptidase n=1 Tax=Enterovirga sp. CN4-39 TaxID=3400910 RepID=UPI003C025CFB